MTKTSAPALMRVEVEKTRRAFEISKDCGCFRVPEVLEYDEVTGVAVFERLDIRPISKAVGWGEPRRTIARWLGTALAIIHRDLMLPHDMCVPLPAELALPHGQVFLHGDLGVENVCVGRSWPRLVIVDWQMTGVYGGEATYGTRYFDILWFVHNLINRPQPRFLFSNPVAPVTRAFIESYFQEARLPYAPDEVAAYAARFFDVEMPRVKQEMARHRRREWLLLPRSRAILRQFIDSLRSMSPNT